MTESNNLFGYLITLILGIVGARFWEYFFKYKGLVNADKRLDKADQKAVKQENLEFMIDRLYGGLITEFKESHTKNENKIAVLEAKVEKQGIKIEILDKKVTIYENHLLDGNKKDKALVNRTILQLNPNLT